MRIPKILYDCSMKFVVGHPELGYANVQEFFRDAIRDKLEIVGGIKFVDASGIADK